MNSEVTEAIPVKSYFDLIPQTWRASEKYPAVLMEGYSSSIADLMGIQSLIDGFRNVIDAVSEHPVTFGFAMYGEGNSILSSTSQSLYREGARTVKVDLTQKTIEPGGYVLFFSPVFKTGGGLNEGVARRSISLARGLLLSIAGHTSADQRLFGVTLNMTDPQTVALSTPIVEMYMPPGRFLYCNADSAELLSKRIEHNRDAEFKRRVSLALTFLGRASSEMDSTVRFTSMWIALEIVAGGYGKIEKLIEQITRDELVRGKLREIKTARDDLFHHGQRYTLSQEQERLICVAITSHIFHAHGVSDSKMREYLKAIASQNISGRAF